MIITTSKYLGSPKMASNYFHVKFLKHNRPHLILKQKFGNIQNIFLNLFLYIFKIDFF